MELSDALAIPTLPRCIRTRWYPLRVGFEHGDLVTVFGESGWDCLVRDEERGRRRLNLVQLI
ncbi:MAG: hypothetical protein H0T54_10035 [Geodermatophilaceae bacterium]|nr:hypothetical protein [Geodermatophilaceae bacterium]